MITLKRYSVNCPENDQDLFMRLYWDTLEANLIDLVWKFTVWETYHHMWAGYVDRDTREFQIARTTGGFFLRKISWFSIKGELRRSVTSKSIEFKVGLSTSSVLQLLMMTAIWIPLGITINDFAGWLVIGVFIGVLAKLVLDDFNNSAELISAYIKNPERVSRLVIK